MPDNSAFVAGAGSGFVVRLLTQPLDVIKIRFQLQVEPISNMSKVSYYKTISQASTRIFLEEGIFGFWKGHIPAQYLSIVFGSVQFYTYEFLYSTTGVAQTTISDLLFGGLAGSVASLFCQPIDVIRTRLAAQGQYKKYSGSINAVMEMAGREGIYGFFRGLIPTTIMIFPQTGIQFYLYNKIKLYFVSKNKDRHQNMAPTNFVPTVLILLSTEPYCQLIPGSVAGVMAKVFVYPLDLSKRRLQVQGFEDARRQFGKFHESLRFIHSIRKTIIDEGFAGLFKGIVPSSIKSGVVSGLTFCFYEQFKKILY